MRRRLLHVVATVRIATSRDALRESSYTAEIPEDRFRT